MFAIRRCSFVGEDGRTAQQACQLTCDQRCDNFRPCDLLPAQRDSQILDILGGISDPTALQTRGTPQFRAARYLIDEDLLLLCPGEEKLVQRYVMSLLYFATNGNSWTRCSQRDNSCPVPNYLSAIDECEWFGLFCNEDFAITEISIQDNNVGGYIPFELGQLSQLEIFALEEGFLSGTIPSNLGANTNLRIIDLDFNMLTGPIPEEIYSLNKLEQLDLNTNKLTGTISESVGNLLLLRLFQVHENLMIGTIPAGVGNLKEMEIAEFFNNTFTGAMPQAVCDNREPPVGAGFIETLTSDCFPNPVPQIVCNCCTGCSAL